MKKEWPTFKRFEIESIYEKWPAEEKTSLNDFVQMLKARKNVGERKLADVRRYIIQILFAFDSDYKHLGDSIKDKQNIPLKTFRNFLVLLNNSKLSIGVKNDMKCYFNLYLKEKFPDWSLRFSNFNDVKLGDAVNEERINPSAMLEKKDIEKLMKSETNILWKAFLIVQYEAGLRTIEARLLKWSDFKFNIDGDLSELSIYATKTKKARTIFIKEATFYLQRLREEQERLEEKGLYIFHSKKDLNQPINKSSVSVWARELSKKSGITFWPYLLRHSRANELYRLSRENKIAKDTALKFMGHNAKTADRTYTHLNKKEILDMLKNQIYNCEELPPEKKAEFEKQIKLMENEMQNLLKRVQLIEMAKKQK